MDIRRQEEDYTREGAEPQARPSDAVPERSTFEQGKQDSLQYVVREEGYPMGSRQDCPPRVAARRAGGLEGVVHNLAGQAIDLSRFSAQDVRLSDIAIALSKICRFNGHVIKTFTVAEHSLIGSRMAPNPGLAMEFLLHDAGEAYIGDIILPVKELFPEIGEFENQITAVIFDSLYPNSGRTSVGVYKKSAFVTQLDWKVYEWENLHLRPAHQFRQRVWDTRKEWKGMYAELRLETMTANLDVIFINEYNKLKELV